MSSLEPAAPTQALRSRQAQPVHVARPAEPVPSSMAVFKPEMLQMAEALAKAGTELLPKAFVNNVGGCLMAIDWSIRYNVAIFEVLGGVSFRNGRATPDARMQKKLASRSGYLTRKIAGDETSCTVAVYGPDGKEVNGDGNGRFTYTIAIAEALGLTRQNALYGKDPAVMLYHRATTRALDQYGPSELAGVFVDPYEDDDPVDVARPRVDLTTDPFLDVPATPAAPELPMAAPVAKIVPPRTPINVPVETVDSEATSAPTGWTDYFKQAVPAAGMTEGKVLKWARENVSDQLKQFSDIVADPAAAQQVADMLDAQ